MIVDLTFCLALDFANVLLYTIFKAYCLREGMCVPRKHFANPP
jgi:hypothetical protein